MTINDKIHQAFQQAQQFVLQNKQQARQWALQHGLDPNQAEQALQFEGFSSWAGHGEALPSIGPGKYDDRKFREGSREYSFWSNPNRQQIGGLDETTIKQWEYQYLKDFRYFVQQFTTCASGAMIA